MHNHAAASPFHPGARVVPTSA